MGKLSSSTQSGTRLAHIDDASSRVSASTNRAVADYDHIVLGRHVESLLAFLE